MTRHMPFLFLGHTRTLYLGALAPRLKLHLAASRLLVSPAAPVRVRVPGQHGVLSGHILVLPVGIKVELECAPDPLLECHLDVSGLDLACLARQATRQQHGIITEFDNPQAWLDQCRDWLIQEPAPDTLAAQLQDWLQPAALVSRCAFQLDPRIGDTITRIRQHAEDNPPLAELASAVGLSSSRLVNLFKSQVGVPIRRYRLWHRLFRACTLLAAEASITEAALQAGFTDAAHLSHTFREILGISPSQLFGRQRAIRVHVESCASDPV